ncbi:hypothetical protein F5X96DRAFT_618295 [Biscogniauxia mediterranea]|nr:hypothetical protein F5X96DRAFT_618295 [Biscogniauxia mediterranea]
MSSLFTFDTRSYLVCFALGVFGTSRGSDDYPAYTKRPGARIFGKCEAAKQEKLGPSSPEERLGEREKRGDCAPWSEI